MLNIIVPMAGAGKRFVDAGYKDPKPFIPIHGKPMIQWVIENVRPTCAHRFIFVCQRAHNEGYNAVENLKKWEPACEIIQLDGLTEGPACTLLTARHLIDNDDPLMSVNSDQLVNVDIDHYLSQMDAGPFDGLIMTVKATGKKWSFVGFDSNGKVERVVEKEVISDEATTGIYNFRRGRDFVAAADAAIAANLRTNGEFYVGPVYNQLIGRGKSVGVYNIGTVDTGMHVLGTPEDFEMFLKKPISAMKRAS
jgi:NDP-sugar pyrophosphorylase family protein